MCSQPRGAGDFVQPVGVGIDDDELPLAGVQMLADRHPHPSHAAHDVVPAQCLNLLFHPAFLQHAAEFRVDDDAPDLKGGVGEDADPADQVGHDKQHGCRVVVRDVLGADGRQRDDREVGRLQPRPVGEISGCRTSRR